MNYRGYTILLERQQCELWTIDDQGEALDYHADCDDNTHDRMTLYIALNHEDVKVAAHATLKATKRHIDIIENISALEPHDPEA